MGRPSYPFLKIKKKKKKDALVLGKKGPDFVDQNIVLRVLGQNTPKVSAEVLYP